MKPIKSIWLQENSWTDVEEYLTQSDIIFVPIGSTEQHGPAAPLGLDSYVAISLVEDAARQTNTLSTPPLWFGDATHHLAFPGTISIRTEILAEYVKDVIRSLSKHGFKKIIIVNGHKITNLSALVSAVRNLKEFELKDVFLAVIDPIKIGIKAAEVREEEEHHAGELEISHMLYKYPHLINKEKIPVPSPELQKRFSSFMPTDLFSPGISIDIPWSSEQQRTMTPSGAFSDASKASTEKGERYHNDLVKEIVRFVDWLKIN